MQFSTLRLRRFAPEEILPLQGIVEECGKHLLMSLGLDHWAPPPPKEVMQRLASTKCVFGVLKEDVPIATFTLGTHGWPQESVPLWMYPDQASLYLSRLAVLPAFQRQGVGSWCMTRAEEMTDLGSLPTIRVDAHADHPTVIEFYRKLGYQERGTCRWVDWHSKERRLVLLEKRLGSGLRQ